MILLVVSEKNDSCKVRSISNTVELLLLFLFGPSISFSADKIPSTCRLPTSSEVGNRAFKALLACKRQLFFCHSHL